MRKILFLACMVILCLVQSKFVVDCEEEIPVLVDKVDELPSWESYGDTIEVVGSYELWHYSGNYWGNDLVIIYDHDLNNNLTSQTTLNEKLIGEMTFEFDIPDEVKEALIEEPDLELVAVVSTKGAVGAPAGVDNNLSLYEYFTDIHVHVSDDNDKVIFTGKPVLRFIDTLLSDNISDPYNMLKTIPVADPKFGVNVFSVFSESTNSHWGAASGYYLTSLTDSMDPLIYENTVNQSSGVRKGITPYDILDSAGRLRDGFTYISSHGYPNYVERSSNDSTIGVGTFKKAGAVGIHYYYSVQVTLYSEIPPNDILVDEYLVPDSAVENQEVLVGFEVESSFAGDLNDVNYQWSVTDTSGNVLTDEDGFEVSVDFLGDTPDENGLFSVLSSTGNKIAYAKFVMPDKDVNIRFAVNEAGDNPVEIDTTDNVVDITIANVLPIVEYGDFTIDYDILNMDVEFPVSDSALSVTLSKGSSYWWIGTTSGGLDLDTVEYPSIYPSYCPDLFQDVEFDGDDIGAYSVSVSLNPTIETTFSRKSFDDDPEDEEYSSEYNALRQGAVTYSGEISRKAKRNKYSKTPPYEKTGTKTVTKSGSFPSGSKEIEVNTLIYNGDNYIYPEYFDENIENNTYYSLSKNLFWTTEPYDFDAIRWMYDMDKNGNRVNPTAVPTQYPRTFTNQGTGEIDISIEESLQYMYDNAISAAESGSQDADDYEHAVFATDKYLQEGYDYPIKSGYYFNPAGSYTFEIETVTYKTTTGETTDHQELVDSLVDSFRYETDLVYIDSSEDAVDIQGNPISSSYNSYEGSSAFLSVADSTSIDNVSLLNVLDKDDDSLRYELTEEEIEYSTSSVSGTDTLFKQILEGYSESSSYDSYSNYKYREFIEGGQVLYRIREKSTVTIEVNPYNRDLYTHVNMQDGDYYIKVWFDSIDLSTSSHAFNTLGVLDGVDELDYMEIHVEGSLFDDVN